MSGNIKRTTCAQVSMKTLKCSAAWKSFHIYSLRSLSIFLYNPIHGMHLGKLRIDVNNACYSKSVQGMTIQERNAISSVEFNSVLYCPNAAFPHAHSYLKYAFLIPYTFLYILFWNTLYRNVLVFYRIIFIPHTNFYI